MPIGQQEATSKISFSSSQGTLYLSKPISQREVKKVPPCHPRIELVEKTEVFMGVLLFRRNGSI
jgi:hypothetical protein